MSGWAFSNKFGAVRTEIAGITFASKKEATRYQELCLLLKAGEITGLRLQPVFPLSVANGLNVRVEIGKYIADFDYVLPGGTRVVEDVKGVRTALYKWKKRHVEAQYDITVTEV